MILSVYKRNDHYLRITIKEDNEPLDLTDLDVCFTVSTGLKNLICKRLDDGIEVVDRSNGLVEIHLTHDDTDIDTGDYYYELVVTDMSGHRYTVLQSILIIKKSHAKECC